MSGLKLAASLATALAATAPSLGCEDAALQAENQRLAQENHNLREENRALLRGRFEASDADWIALLQSSRRDEIIRMFRGAF